MTTSKLLSMGLIAAAMLGGPAMAREHHRVVQQPTVEADTVAANAPFYLGERVSAPLPPRRGPATTCPANQARAATDHVNATGRITRRDATHEMARERAALTSPLPQFRRGDAAGSALRAAQTSMTANSVGLARTVPTSP